MKTRLGDLIEMAVCGDFNLIAHGCNCFCTMGAGIAKGIREWGQVSRNHIAWGRFPHRAPDALVLDENRIAFPISFPQIATRMTTSILSPKFQVVIPKEVRKAL